jgi:hypothetical protein
MDKERKRRHTTLTKEPPMSHFDIFEKCFLVVHPRGRCSNLGEGNKRLLGRRSGVVEESKPTPTYISRERLIREMADMVGREICLQRFHKKVPP